MKAKTRFFGKVEIEDEKIISFEQGLIGFPDLRRFTLIYDKEKKDGRTISWLQSMDEPEIAFPVMDPLTVCPDYNPNVEEEMLKSLGDLTEENLFVLVTVTVPKDIEQIAVNLKAPIVINVEAKRGSQLIVEDDYPVKYKIYEYIRGGKEKAGE